MRFAMQFPYILLSKLAILGQAILGCQVMYSPSLQSGHCMSPFYSLYIVPSPSYAYSIITASVASSVSLKKTRQGLKHGSLVCVCMIHYHFIYNVITIIHAGAFWKMERLLTILS